MLAGDTKQATRDRYRRLLAYVWLPGGYDLGRPLSSAASGRCTPASGPSRGSALPERPEDGEKARARALGRVRAVLRRRGRRGAVPRLVSGLLLPPPPPDLDCADVSGSSFAVVGSDPHRFDGDGDGVGCED